MPIGTLQAQKVPIGIFSAVDRFAPCYREVRARAREMDGGGRQEVEGPKPLRGQSSSDATLMIPATRLTHTKSDAGLILITTLRRERFMGLFHERARRDERI